MALIVVLMVYFPTLLVHRFVSVMWNYQNAMKNECIASQLKVQVDVYFIGAQEFKCKGMPGIYIFF